MSFSHFPFQAPSSFLISPAEILQVIRRVATDFWFILCPVNQTHLQTFIPATEVLI